MDELARSGESFAFETTLAGRNFARRIVRWREQDYEVDVTYLCLRSADAAVDRVAQRVSKGGHHVPEEVIRRRFETGRRNFDEVYRPIVSFWALVDNTGADPLALSWGVNP